MDDIFDQFFGGGDHDSRDGESDRSQKEQDLKTRLEISLEDAYEGVEKRITIKRPEPCDECDGSGHPPGTASQTCPECEGSGEVTEVEQTPLGRVQQTSSCNRCQGEGTLYEEHCATCDGDGFVREAVTLTVSVPRGIKSGQTLRMDGEGIQNPDGRDSDLLIEVDIAETDPFTRDGADLYREFSVPRARLESGGTVEVECIDDTVLIDLPPETSSGTVFELEGRGMPKLREDGRGDLYISVREGQDAGKRSRRVGPPDEIPSVPTDSVTYDSLSMGEQIGSGGEAAVVQATVETDDGEVIIAVKRPQLDGTIHTETVERVLDEAKTWDRLDDHDHVVGVVGYGTSPIPWIAMEYMDGGHLGEYAGSIPTDQAIWTAHAVAEAVHHAHRHGTAHLDLKPENVLFRTVAGAWDVPKVADWGLSETLLDRSRSPSGLSPPYAAPEQFTDEYGPTDDLTDVYQLGAVCFELFTGQPPFDRTTSLDERVNRPPPDPQSIADVPAAVADVVTTAMAPDRGDRYDSVVYIRDWLREAYQSE